MPESNRDRKEAYRLPDLIELLECIMTYIVSHRAGLPRRGDTGFEALLLTAAINHSCASSRWQFFLIKQPLFLADNRIEPSLADGLETTTEKSVARTPPIFVGAKIWLEKSLVLLVQLIDANRLVSPHTFVAFLLAVSLVLLGNRRTRLLEEVVQTRTQLFGACRIRFCQVPLLADVLDDVV